MNGVKLSTFMNVEKNVDVTTTLPQIKRLKLMTSEKQQQPKERIGTEFNK